VSGDRFRFRSESRIPNESLVDTVVIWDSRRRYRNSLRHYVPEKDPTANIVSVYGGARVLSSHDTSKRQVLLRDIEEAYKAKELKKLLLMVPVVEDNVQDAVFRLKRAAQVVEDALRFYAEKYQRPYERPELFRLVYVYSKGIYELTPEKAKIRLTEG